LLKAKPEEEQDFWERTVGDSGKLGNFLAIGYNRYSRAHSAREGFMQALDSFLKTVMRSGLLNREQLQEALRGLPRDQHDDAQAVADFLVRAGKLSRFQAKKLLQGKSVGLVLGQFQVLAPLGRGGMSTVYLARDSRRHCLVALKILPPKRAREEERILARFLREMNMSRRVSHPHLAQTYDVGTVADVHFIAMEFIPGQSLYRLVTKQGPLPIPQAAKLFAEVAAGLEHAHWRGLIHRDLKPSNIMVTPNDHAKVLDLGLAMIQGEDATDHRIIGGRGYVVGSMDYIAPEQTENAAKVDARSDIYGLGCTLYFALTGRPPFPGGDALEKIKRQKTEEPVPVWQLNSSAPPGFVALVDKMMAKRPDDRFATAKEVRRELLFWRAPEPALPVDQAGDSGYQQAVAVLATEDDDSDEPLPEVIPVDGTEVYPRNRMRLFSWLPIPGTVRRHQRRPWSMLLLPVGLGMLAGLGFVAVWVMIMALYR
jgi:serine/threonine protein kinase